MACTVEAKVAHVIDWPLEACPKIARGVDPNCNPTGGGGGNGTYQGLPIIAVVHVNTNFGYSTIGAGPVSNVYNAGGGYGPNANNPTTGGPIYVIDSRTFQSDVFHCLSQFEASAGEVLGAMAAYAAKNPARFSRLVKK